MLRRRIIWDMILNYKGLGMSEAVRKLKKIRGMLLKQKEVKLYVELNRYIPEKFQVEY